MRSNGKLLNIYKKYPRNNLMYGYIVLIKGSKDDNTMSGEDFIFNITNQLINTAWSAIIFHTQLKNRRFWRRLQSWFETKSLNIEEGNFACLFTMLSRRNTT